MLRFVKRLPLDQCCVNTHIERRVLRTQSSQSLPCCTSSLDVKPIDKRSSTAVIPDIPVKEISIFTLSFLRVERKGQRKRVSFSLSLSLLSQKSEFHRMVPECDMSICEDAISNLVILVNPCESSQLRGLVLPQSYQIGRICEVAITVSQICEAGRIGIGLTYLGLVLLDWFQDSQICEDVIATSHTSNLLRSISFGRSATDSGQIGSTL